MAEIFILFRYEEFEHIDADLRQHPILRHYDAVVDGGGGGGDELERRTRRRYAPTAELAWTLVDRLGTILDIESYLVDHFASVVTADAAADESSLPNRLADWRATLAAEVAAGGGGGAIVHAPETLRRMLDERSSAHQRLRRSDETSSLADDVTRLWLAVTRALIDANHALLESCYRSVAATAPPLLSARDDAQFRRELALLARLNDGALTAFERRLAQRQHQQHHQQQQRQSAAIIVGAGEAEEEKESSEHEPNCHTAASELIPSPTPSPSAKKAFVGDGGGDAAGDGDDASSSLERRHLLSTSEEGGAPH